MGLFERDTETLFPTLDELGVGFLAYSPLGRGFITGTAKPAGQCEATDIRTVDPRRQPGNFEKCQRPGEAEENSRNAAHTEAARRRSPPHTKAPPARPGYNEAAAGWTGRASGRFAGGTFHYQIWRPPPRAGLLMSLLMPRHICRLRGGSRYVAVTDALLKQGA
ncbi:hypothetical protein Srufu_014030 [Streptomyces libani subsp. rufus]|nr:hypothetical protein Srufu_014030 [Streptomyces libani subsp. rufus]